MRDIKAEHYKARWQNCLIRVSEILNPTFIFEASSPGIWVKVKGLVFFQSKHIYDGKCTSKSKIPALCTNCINLKRLLWSISNFAKQFCSGRRSVILKIVRKGLFVEVVSGKEGLGQNWTFLKLFNYWVTLMTCQHPEILEFLSSWRSPSEYEGYVRILLYNPWDITAADYRVMWHFTSSKYIMVIYVLKIVYWPQKNTSPFQ